MKKLLIALPFSILLTACNDQGIEETSTNISVNQALKQRLRTLHINTV